MPGLKDFFFDSIRRLPLFFLRLIGFDFLHQAANQPSLIAKSTKQKIAESAKSFFFLFNCINFAMYHVLRFIYRLHHPYHLNIFINAAVDCMNAVAILSKILAIYFFKSTIMRMFETLEGSSYVKFDREAQQEVTGAFRVYKSFERINLCLCNQSGFHSILMHRPLVTLSTFGWFTSSFSLQLSFSPATW